MNNKIYKVNNNRGMGAPLIVIISIIMVLFSLIVGFFTQIKSNTRLIYKLEELDKGYYLAEGYSESILALIKKSVNSPKIGANDSYFFKVFTATDENSAKKVANNKELLKKNLKFFNYPYDFVDNSFSLIPKIYPYKNDINGAYIDAGERYGSMHIVIDLGARAELTKEIKITNCLPENPYIINKPKYRYYPLLTLTACGIYDSECKDYNIIMTARDTAKYNNRHKNFTYSSDPEIGSLTETDVIFGKSIEAVIKASKSSDIAEKWAIAAIKNDKANFPFKKWKFTKASAPGVSGMLVWDGNYPIAYEKIWYSFKNFKSFLNKFGYEKDGKYYLFFDGIAMIANYSEKQFTIDKELIISGNAILIAKNGINIRANIKKNSPDDTLTLVSLLYNNDTAGFWKKTVSFFNNLFHSSILLPDGIYIGSSVRKLECSLYTPQSKIVVTSSSLKIKGTVFAMQITTSRTSKHNFPTNLIIYRDNKLEEKKIYRLCISPITEIEFK